MFMSQIETIKAFISYSWSTPEHEQWVSDLAERLCEDGIDVQLDKWGLKEGHDKYAFMEKMVTDPEIKKVVIISDRVYAEKADQRTGGVGTETQIITPELYGRTEQNKFVIVTTEKDEHGNAYIPTYYKSKIYIDLSDDDSYSKNYDQLLRWLFDRPVYRKPKIGNPPAFLFEENPISIGTTTSYNRCLNAIREVKPNAVGSFDDYCDLLINNLEFFRMDLKNTTNENPEDEIFYKNVTSLLAVRDEILTIFTAILKYTPTDEFISKIHHFFERIYDYNNIPKGQNSYKEYEVENYEQFNYQLFLYTVALFLRYERFDKLSSFLLQRFLLYNYHYGKKDNYTFYIFNYSKHRLIQHRNTRLSLRKISPIAHYLHEDWKHKTINHDELIQAEIVLYIFSLIKFNGGQRGCWYPYNIPYLSFNKIPDIFIKAESKTYLKKLASLLSLDELKIFSQREYAHLNFGSGNTYSISNYINLNKLGTFS